MAIAVIAMGFAALAPRFAFTTAITEFLPDGRTRAAQVAALMAQSEAARVMILDVASTASDSPRAIAVSLLEFVRALPGVATARSGLNDREVTQILEFLQTWPATTFIGSTEYSDDAIRSRLGELRDQLAGPLSALVRGTAQRDPLGGISQWLRALLAWQPSSIIDDDGIVMTLDRKHAFVFVETKASAFDSDAQRRFRSELDQWMARSAPPGATLQTAGAAQFAIASEEQIKRDVNRIGFLSTIGILATFLILFGSLRMIAIGFVPMLFGSALAMVVCHMWFGRIHGITIAFGTSLLGVGLDYTEHYFAHFVLSPTVPAGATMKRVAPSIGLGALTTVIGFVGIAASGVAGLRQMAAFSVIAIAGSIAATYWWLPPWMPTQYRPPRTLGAVHRAVTALLRWLAVRKWPRWGQTLLVVGAGTAMVLGLRSVVVSDNVALLIGGSGHHVRDDREVRSRLGSSTSLVAVVAAPTDDVLATAIAKVAVELESARASGQLGSAMPLSVIAPSVAEQVARWYAARSHAPQIRSAMAELGFVSDQFQPFWDDLAASPPRWLTLADVRGSALAPFLGGVLPSPTIAGPVALIPLAGVRGAGHPLSTSELASLRAAVPSASIVESTSTMADAFRGVRTSTIAASSIGFVVIALLLFVRYRSLRSVATALGPAMLACAATTSTLAAMGVPLTILHVMSLLLVVSLGVDFGIFFVDAEASQEDSVRTMVSILTASATTLLSFGLLAASDSPVLSAIGTTVTFGVAYSLWWCFVMVSLRGQRDNLAGQRGYAR
jgi:predicted exporter